MSNLDFTIAIMTCSDGNCLISRERLLKLMGMMPVLNFLIFGHPNMKKTHDIQDNKLLISTPYDFNIKRSNFVFLIEVAFDIINLLNYCDTKQLDELMNIVTILGGCTYIENKLRSMLNKENKETEQSNYLKQMNPMTPEQDDNKLFSWSFVNLNDNNVSYNAFNLCNNGYSATIPKKNVIYFRCLNNIKN